jgi:hypothetical protein
MAGRYRPNPYHNFNHGVHVLHGCFVQWRFGSGARCAHELSQLHTLALFTAAVGHDVEHPGVTNAFLIQTKGATRAQPPLDTCLLRSLPVP